MNLKISTLLLAEEAQRRGWLVEYLDQDNTNLMKITSDGNVSNYFKSTVTMRESCLGALVTDNKYETYLVLKSARIPVPETIVLGSMKVAISFMRYHRRIVVKPTGDDHGNGVSVSVSNEKELRQAVKRASIYKGAIILQRQLDGHDHRLLVVGEEVFVARRRKPIVIGDGRSTIKQLIEQKNKDPLRGSGHKKPLSFIDLNDAEDYLGVKINVKPKINERIEVLGTSNLSKGGEAVELTNSAHNSYKLIAKKAAQILNLTVCAIDLICKDITKPLNSQRCGVIEMNVSPGIRMHHFPSEGNPINIASKILDEIYKEQG